MNDQNGQNLGINRMNANHAENVAFTIITSQSLSINPAHPGTAASFC